MLLADSTGTKYPLFLVLKTDAKSTATSAQVDEAQHGFGDVYWRKTVLPMMDGSGAEIYGNKHGWWNEGLTLAFLDHHFGRRENLQADNVLLLLDDLRAHFTKRVRALAKVLNVELLRVPPGFTWACQPADLSWNKPFKDQLRGRWVAHLFKQLESRVDGDRFVFVGPDREDVVEWAVDAWAALSKATITSGFSKAQILVSLPSARDDAYERHVNYEESLDAVVKAMVDLNLVTERDVVRGEDDLLHEGETINGAD
jgi:hypothetical protein